MLTIDKVTFGYTNDPVLDEVSGLVGPGQKIGLVGVNGAGKTTLLKIITGEIAPDFGEIRVPETFGYISQELNKELEFDEDDTIGDFINSKRSGTRSHYPDHEIAKLLAKIGMADKLPSSNFSQLSGGQKTKVMIIKLLLEEPELLILDEPTNFLDVPSAHWLMDYLCSYPGAVLVVSHDLRLMNRSLDKIWFLNEFTHKIEQYKGNYEKFIAQKELEDDQLVKQLKKEQAQYHKLLKTAAHISKHSQQSMKMKGARYREKARKVRENMTKLSRKSKKMRLKHEIKQVPGHKVLTVENVAKVFETDAGRKQVLVDINFELTRKQRLVVIGVNGAGKSTLLKIIAGMLPPDDGPGGVAKIELGHNVDFGYYAQEYEGLDPNGTPLDEFEEPQIGKLRGHLGKFLFSEDKVFQKVGSLSGGEKTRLALAKIFYAGHNLLLLDEPTTFLDPDSQEILGDALANYPETIVLVSHNLELVRTIEPTHVLLLPEEKFTFWDDKLLERVTLS